MLSLPMFCGVLLLAHVSGASSALLLANRRNAQMPASDGQQAVASALQSLDAEGNIAEAARGEAEATSKALQVGQNAGVADVARRTAEENFEEAAHVVPAADAMVMEARSLAAEASRHAQHALQMAAKIRRLPLEAAQKAVGVVEDKIKKAAYDAADLAKDMPPESNLEHSRRVMRSVAEAYEPYQLGLLRAQKSMALAFAKAKSAAGAVQGLATQAHQLASKANELQAAGGGIKAQQMMVEAHATMRKAMNMKGWAEKFYAQANEINSSLSRYQVAGNFAANQAADELGPPVTPEPDAERALYGAASA